MKEQFVYVFSEQDMTALLEGGLTLIKADSRNKIYVFENGSEAKRLLQKFSRDKYVTSSTLTF